MKIKTSELTGAALDWAVAKAEGYVEMSVFPPWKNDNGAYGDAQVMVKVHDVLHDYRPSMYWAQGGPIIERNGICLEFCTLKYWEADIPDNFYLTQLARSPLVAAMRCYVASKFGDEVDVPDELMP